MLDGHGPQIHQFIQLCQKQNSSLPIHDISNQLELLLKGSEKFTLKIEFYALNESSQIPLPIIRDIQSFLLSLDYQTIRSGLIYICKSLIESTSQKLVKPSLVLSNQILIQIISQTHPTAFLGQNVAGKDQSPAKVVMKSYEGEFEKAEKALAWILAQQSIPLQAGRVVHPKCMEVWYSYYLPKVVERLRCGKECREYLEFMLVVLQREFDVGIPDIAVIPIKSILELLKAKSTLEPNPELELIYSQSRQLLCDSGRAPSILTNPSHEVFAELMIALDDQKIQSDVLEILVKLLSSQTVLPSTKDTISRELGKLFRNEFSKYKSQTDLLVGFLYKLPHNQKLWKRVQRSKIHDLLVNLSLQKYQHKHLAYLLKQTRPQGSFLSCVISTLQWYIVFAMMVFLLYSLIYVQCAPTRVCPLPFSPQDYITTFKTKLREMAVYLSPYQSMMEKIWNDSIQTSQDYYNLVLKVEVERMRMMWDQHGKDIEVYFERIGGFEVFDGLVSISKILWSEIKRGALIAIGFGNWVLEEKVPKYFDFVMKNLDKYAVLFVDEYLPILREWVVIGRKYVMISAKALRVYGVVVVENLESVLVSLKSHPVYSILWVEYERYIKEYVDISWQYVGPVVALVLEFIDFCWKILEGESGLTFAVIKEYFVFLISSIPSLDGIKNYPFLETIKEYLGNFVSAIQK